MTFWLKYYITNLHNLAFGEDFPNVTLPKKPGYHLPEVPAFCFEVSCIKIVPSWKVGVVKIAFSLLYVDKSVLAFNGILY